MPSRSARSSSSASASIDLRGNSALVVARLMRYEAGVKIGLTVRSLAKSATSSSVIVFPFHWFEFFAKSAIAEALIIEARSKTVCRPPLVEMCAPMRSPCFSWKRKRGMREFAGPKPGDSREHSRLQCAVRLSFHRSRSSRRPGFAARRRRDDRADRRNGLSAKPDRGGVHRPRRHPETMAALTKGAPAAPSAQAQKTYETWKNTSERKLLSVESRLLAAASGDADADKFFAARIHGTHLGDFDYVIDQVDRVAVLGQWVAEKLSEREKRRAAGRLEKEHRRGRECARS